MNINKLMTGQLVAFYKETHDETYSKEYVRRLCHIGFNDSQANNMFMYELMTLKSDSIALLTDENYITNYYFNLINKLLLQPDEYYIAHQMFLCSDITKIWDEAEYIYKRGRVSDVTDDVWNEIASLTRYQGGKLFVEYLTSMAEHTGIDINLISRYAMSEQQMLFKYKWNPNGNEWSPYGEVKNSGEDTTHHTSANKPVLLFFLGVFLLAISVPGLLGLIIALVSGEITGGLGIIVNLLSEVPLVIIGILLVKKNSPPKRNSKTND